MKQKNETNLQNKKNLISQKNAMEGQLQAAIKQQGGNFVE